MSEIKTVHEGREVFREVHHDGETHRFAVTGDESTREGYEYEGEDVPEEIDAALQDWIHEHHSTEEESNAGTDGSAAQ